MVITKLREGQQFQLCEDRVAVVNDRIYHFGRGIEYRLDYRGDISQVDPNQLEDVSTEDVLIVEEVYGSITGWLVIGWRQRDGKYFHFHQRIGEEEWRKIYPGTFGDPQGDNFVTVRDIGWPEPSSLSLSWAVHAIIGEATPGHGNRVNWDDCKNVAEMSLEDGLRKALSLMADRGVENPEDALRERGFLI